MEATWTWTLVVNMLYVCLHKNPLWFGYCTVNMDCLFPRVMGMGYVLTLVKLFKPFDKSTEVPVNGGRMYNGPKVGKFIVG